MQANTQTPKIKINKSLKADIHIKETKNSLSLSWINFNGFRPSRPEILSGGGHECSITWVEMSEESPHTLQAGQPAPSATYTLKYRPWSLTLTGMENTSRFASARISPSVRLASPEAKNWGVWRAVVEADSRAVGASGPQHSLSRNQEPRPQLNGSRVLAPQFYDN